MSEAVRVREGVRDLISRTQLALADPEAPWYGSDVVPMVGDVIDRLVALLTLTREYAWDHDQHVSVEGEFCHCSLCRRLDDFEGEKKG